MASAILLGRGPGTDNDRVKGATARQVSGISCSRRTTARASSPGEHPAGLNSGEDGEGAHRKPAGQSSAFAAGAAGVGQGRRGEEGRGAGSEVRAGQLCIHGCGEGEGRRGTPVRLSWRQCRKTMKGHRTEGETHHMSPVKTRYGLSYRGMVLLE